MSLPSDQRLTRTADFAAVRESGRSWNGKFLILAVRLRPDRGRSHFGFTTTRRIGNAVKRNLVRRRLRMIAREHSPLITLTHDVVTIARHTAVRAEFEALRQDWIRLATRAGLLTAEMKPPVMASPKATGSEVSPTWPDSPAGGI